MDKVKVIVSVWCVYTEPFMAAYVAAISGDHRSEPGWDDNPE